MGVNPDRKSGVEPRRRLVEQCETFRQLLQLRWHRPYRLVLCSSFPSDPTSNAERGILATGHTRISISSAQACTWRGHSSFADQRRHNTESSSLPVISPGSFGVEPGARGCSRRWEGFSSPIGQLTPASSRAPPAPTTVPTATRTTPWSAARCVSSPSAFIAPNSKDAPVLAQPEFHSQDRMSALPRPWRKP